MDKNTTHYTTLQSYFGALMTFIAGINWNNAAAICGILFGLATLLIGWYYKQKEYELKKLEVEKLLNEKSKHVE